MVIKKIIKKSNYSLIFSLINLLLALFVNFGMTYFISDSVELGYYFKIFIYCNYGSLLINSFWRASYVFFGENNEMCINHLFSLLKLGFIISITSLLIYLFVFYDFLIILAFTLAINISKILSEILILKGKIINSYAIEFIWYCFFLLVLIFLEKKFINNALVILIWNCIALLFSILILILTMPKIYNSSWFFSNKIIKDSFKLNLSEIVYGVRIPFIISALPLVSIAIFNYSLKMSTLISSVVNIDRNKELIYKLSSITDTQFEYKRFAKEFVKKSLKIYLIISILALFVLSFLTTQQFIDVFDDIIKYFTSEFYFYLYGLMFMNAIVTIEMPYARIIQIKKKFNSILIINVLYLLLLICVFFTVSLIDFKLAVISSLIISQLLNLILYYSKL